MLAIDVGLATDEETQRTALRASRAGRRIVVDLHDAGSRQAYAN